MTIIEYTGPSNPQEIRKYLLRRTKDQIVREYLRLWREFGDLERERDEYKQAAEHYVPVAQALAAHCAQLLSAGWRLKHELQQWSLTGRDPQTSTVLAAWDTATDEKPTSSLARLIAEKQAEALATLRLEDCATLQDVLERQHAAINELRRQAEGGDHERF